MRGRGRSAHLRRPARPGPARHGPPRPPASPGPPAPGLAEHGASPRVSLAPGPAQLGPVPLACQLSQKAAASGAPPRWGAARSSHFKVPAKTPQSVPALPLRGSPAAPPALGGKGLQRPSPPGTAWGREGGPCSATSVQFRGLVCPWLQRTCGKISPNGYSKFPVTFLRALRLQVSCQP